MYLIINLLVFVVTVQSYKDLCLTPEIGLGTCIPMQKCAPILIYSKKPSKTLADVMFLQESSCGFGVKSKVCCPKEDEWWRFLTKLITTSGDDLSIHYYDLGVPSTTTLTTMEAPETKSSFNSNTVPNGFPGAQCPPSVAPPTFDSRCCGIDVSSPFKIKGGDDISIDKHPWVAVLLYEDDRIGCGGTLISSRYVLTAAHCIEGKLGPVVKVRLADYDLATFPTDRVELGTGDFEEIDAMEFSVERQIVHPQYNFEDYMHDIGLVKLSDDAPFTDFIRPVCLPNYDVTKALQNGTLLTIAGWGYTRTGSEINQIKQELKLPYANKEECQASYVEEVTDKQFCAGGDSGKDACDGDSGNTLVYEDIAVGVTMAVGVGSFGPLICGLKGTPSVFVNVYKYLEWILSETV